MQQPVTVILCQNAITWIQYPITVINTYTKHEFLLNT